MRRPVDRMDVNHRHTSDHIRIMPSEDGMTATMEISGERGWMSLKLSKSQWRRLRRAMDTAYETVAEDGEAETAFSDGFKAGWAAGKMQGEEVRDGTAS